ncbi:hypothetical protein MSAN_00608600 [Mycena sanguinolenta]|uniref:Uncharacterized protein n=1 Tax=Mycena sanguinolenta TaxID=230812 RepID=A0A8H7DJW4_9AGAR|nr:hypothetical protein MSAN_00608600 [Mycena sanguinolenta]
MPSSGKHRDGGNNYYFGGGRGGSGGKSRSGAGGTGVITSESKIGTETVPERRRIVAQMQLTGRTYNRIFITTAREALRCCTMP